MATTLNTSHYRMAVPVLHNIDLYGNQVIRPILKEAKVGPKPASPEPGHFYMIDNILYYRTANNTDQPVHENALTEVTSNTSALTVETNGSEIALEIDTADESTDGLMPSNYYALINESTDQATPETLVQRDDSGGVQFALVTATGVSTSSVNGLSQNQDNDSNDYAVSLGYFRTELENIQSAIASRDFKENVRVALTANLALTSTPGTYDGVAIALNDAIALLNQTNPIQNGIYLVTGGGLVRRADSDSEEVMTSGATYPVTEGTLSGRLVMLTTATGFSVDTDPLSFLVIDDSASAGDGLIKSGKTIHAVGTANRISVTADAIDIASGYVGQASITTLGTVTDAVWNAEAIAITYGGTGATSTEEALTNLGAVQEEEVILLGDGSATSFTITSDLDNPLPQIETYFLVTGEWIRTNVDIRINASTNEITLYAQQGSNPIGNNTLKVVVRGKKYTT